MSYWIWMPIMVTLNFVFLSIAMQTEEQKKSSGKNKRWRIWDSGEFCLFSFFVLFFERTIHYVTLLPAQPYLSKTAPARTKQSYVFTGVHINVRCNISFWALFGCFPLLLFLPVLKCFGVLKKINAIEIKRGDDLLWTVMVKSFYIYVTVFVFLYGWFSVQFLC